MESDESILLDSRAEQVTKLFGSSADFRAERSGGRYQTHPTILFEKIKIIEIQRDYKNIINLILKFRSNNLVVVWIVGRYIKYS